MPDEQDFLTSPWPTTRFFLPRPAPVERRWVSLTFFLRLSLDAIHENHKDQIPVLYLHTGKPAFRGGIESEAMVSWEWESEPPAAQAAGPSPGLVIKVTGSRGDADYQKEIHHDPASRVTQQAIDKQHAAVFSPANVEALIAEAREYYASGKDDFEKWWDARTAARKQATALKEKLP
jgi:hypothetical protein